MDGPGAVPKRAFTAYRNAPCRSIVVGTSKSESVIVRAILPEANPLSSATTAILFSWFWTT